MSESFNGFSYEKDVDGIVTITVDMEGSVNAINENFHNAIVWVVDKLEAEKDLQGVVVTSAKNIFLAGGDINEIFNARKGEELKWFKYMEILKWQLRRIEKLSVPAVAAINGAALGGGLELCLACNYRVAWASPSVQLGLPEVNLGLLPGAGGVVRAVHMLGLEKALPLLLEGRTLNPSQALELGIVDSIVSDTEELLDAAKQWIKDHPTECIQPWDKKDYIIDGGGIGNPASAQILAMATPQVFKKTRGLLPAPERILSVMHDVMAVDFDTALRIETRGLVELMMTPQAKNLMSSNFLQLNKIKSGISRPKGIKQGKVSKIGVLGAGMMGQGIVYACAMAGIQVVLKDVTLEAADKGKQCVAGLLDKLIKRGRTSEEKKAELLAMIHPTADYSDFQGCELVVEAVFENVELKSQVTQEIEAVLPEEGVLGSNTSTLPISLLANGSSRPENFIGIHFFSPVDKMPLVEIICGDRTSEKTLATAYDFARQIKKIPIVVNDSVGFYTSRVFSTYLDEGCRLLTEGVDPVYVDQMGKYVGMPVGPLGVHDEVSQKLIYTMGKTQKSLGVYCTKYDSSVAMEVATTLVSKYERGGRHHGGGFYDYSAQGGKHIWRELYNIYGKEKFDVEEDDVKDRLLFRPVIESLKCLEEGVLRSVSDGNIGSLMGIGAPAWTGGYIQFVNTYGLERFIDRCSQLAMKYGDRFIAPEIVSKNLVSDGRFE